jgi:hypothetical protein
MDQPSYWHDIAIDLGKLNVGWLLCNPGVLFYFP